MFYSIFQRDKLNKHDVNGILNYAKDRESGNSRIQSFKDNLSGCSVAAQKYVKDAEKAGKATNEMVAGLENVPKVGDGVKNAFLNIASALGIWLLVWL